MSKQVTLSATKLRMTVMALPHPLMVENLSVFSENIFKIRVSKLHLSEWLPMVSAKVIRILDRRDQVCPLRNKYYFSGEWNILGSYFGTTKIFIHCHARHSLTS